MLLVGLAVREDNAACVVGVPVVVEGDDGVAVVEELGDVVMGA
jgi:hypothetical protein